MEQARKVLFGRSPWAGYTPDLDPHLIGFNGMVAGAGLVARPAPGALGEVLMPPDGFARLDSANLPLVDVSAAATEVVMLAQFLHTNASGAITGDFGITPLAIVAGDGSTTDSGQLYRLRPSNSAWQNVAHAAGTGIEGARTSTQSGLFDWAIMPEGAPLRNSEGGASGSLSNITEPCIVFTNNLDEVYVYPSADATNTYNELTDIAALDNGSGFLARSVANFRGSLYFLNTSEAGVRYRQRLRRTQKFSANPDPAVAGSSALDFREFQRDGVKALPLGDVLVCYFEDGVAFVSETGNPTAPVARIILPVSRGLLGTHAVCPVGNNLHFGIFTDGWYFLDSNGRWSEAGILNVEGGARLPKWRKTFYSELNFDQRDRLFCYYDEVSNFVYISVPVGDTAETDVTNVWIYDIDGDRVWRTEFEATCWGGFDTQITDALLWSTADPLLWSTITGSWASYSARFGVRAPVHGNATGLVFAHSPDLITQDGTAPSYSYRSHWTDGGNPRTLLLGNRSHIEYVNVGGPGMTLRLRSNQGTVESANVALNNGDEGSVQHVSSHFRLSGTAPVMVRSHELDILDLGVEARN